LLFSTSNFQAKYDNCTQNHQATSTLILQIEWQSW
jgi:hypothetical protein